MHSSIAVKFLRCFTCSLAIKTNFKDCINPEVRFLPGSQKVSGTILQRQTDSPFLFRKQFLLDSRSLARRLRLLFLARFAHTHTHTATLAAARHQTLTDGSI